MDRRLRSRSIPTSTAGFATFTASLGSVDDRPALVRSGSGSTGSRTSDCRRRERRGTLDGARLTPRDRRAQRDRRDESTEFSGHRQGASGARSNVQKRATSPSSSQAHGSRNARTLRASARVQSFSRRRAHPGGGGSDAPTERILHLARARGRICESRYSGSLYDGSIRRSGASSDWEFAEPDPTDGAGGGLLRQVLEEVAGYVTGRLLIVRRSPRRSPPASTASSVSSPSCVTRSKVPQIGPPMMKPHGCRRRSRTTPWLSTSPRSARSLMGSANDGRRHDTDRRRTSKASPRPARPKLIALQPSASVGSG